MGSGAAGVQRIDGDDLRWPRRGTTTWAAMQGFRRAVDRWGGRGGRGGAFERIGEARGWRWPRGSSSVAAASFGRVRVKSRGEDEDAGE